MKKLLIPMLALAVLAACKKKSTDPDQRSLLVDKKWTITEEYVRDSTGSTSADLWPSEAAYLKDDYITWYGTGYYANSDNVVLAPNHTLPLEDTGTWQLNNSLLAMASTMVGSTGTTLTVKSIDDQHLTVEFPISNKRTGIYNLRAN